MRNNQFIQIENSIEIWVETFGKNSREACLFISGAGANSSFWSDRLCVSLVNEGFFVIKYDHRDIGYSSKINFDENPYDVMQLAKDAINVLDAFGKTNAHVIGHSMGGFIAQLMAIHYPGKIISLVSASSSTNSPSVPVTPEKTWEVFMQSPPQNNYDEDLQGFLSVWEYLNGTAKFNRKLAIHYTKNIYERQEVIGALGESHVKAQHDLYDRSAFLKQVDKPTLVIHGEEDYLVDKYGGIQTADCIKNSELVLIPRMGHMSFNTDILLRFENEIIEFIKKNKNANS